MNDQKIVTMLASNIKRPFDVPKNLNLSEIILKLHENAQTQMTSSIDNSLNQHQAFLDRYLALISSLQTQLDQVVSQHLLADVQEIKRQLQTLSAINLPKLTNLTRCLKNETAIFYREAHYQSLETTPQCRNTFFYPSAALEGPPCNKLRRPAAIRDSAKTDSDIAIKLNEKTEQFSKHVNETLEQVNWFITTLINLLSRQLKLEVPLGIDPPDQKELFPEAHSLLLDNN